jgi:hypothetical protein
MVGTRPLPREVGASRVRQAALPSADRSRPIPMHNGAGSPRSPWIDYSTLEKQVARHSVADILWMLRYILNYRVSAECGWMGTYFMMRNMGSQDSPGR